MDAARLSEYLIQNQSRITDFRTVTGFDGFVDEMIRPVEERESLDVYRPVESISRFGELILQAAGKSSLREIVVTDMHPGGCAVNMGDGLAALGTGVETYATVGDPIHPAFSAYAERARVISWGREPGRTLAYEFADGKLMFSSVTQLADFNVDLVKGFLKQGSFQKSCAKADLIALTDWSMYPHMTGVWRLLQEQVFKALNRRSWLFVDLVDPSSRSESDIRDMLDALKGFTESTRVVLGLNQNEASLLARVCGDIPLDNAVEETALRQAADLRKRLGLEQVVTHAHAFAVCADSAGSVHADGPYCASPRKSTGAGDRFNAGYALGLMLELPPEDCLMIGCASSGYFVRYAESGSLRDLTAFMRDWHSGDLVD